MNCTQCGAEVQPQEKFCGHCGAPIAAQQPEQTQQSAQPQGFAQQNQNPYGQPGANNQGTYNPNTYDPNTGYAGGPNQPQNGYGFSGQPVRMQPKRQSLNLAIGGLVISLVLFLLLYFTGIYFIGIIAFLAPIYSFTAIQRDKRNGYTGFALTIGLNVLAIIIAVIMYMLVILL